ncbi:MAG: response regulator [Prolixibacteraceae bacterium]
MQKFLRNKPNSLLQSISFLFFLLLASPVGAQQNVIVEDLSATTTLPEGAVNCLLQDHDGFIWLGTWKGLYRYDGFEVINFSSINPKFNALKIEEILIDGNSLWVGSFVTGLIRIDLTTYEFTNYTIDSDKNHRLSDNNIRTLCSMPDNTLVGTERGGFLVIDSLGNVIKTYTTESHPEILQNQQVSRILKIDDQHVLIGDNSLFSFNIQSEEVKRINFPELNIHIDDLAYISNTEFLVSTLHGLYYLNLENEPKLERIIDHRIKSVLKTNDTKQKKYIIGTHESLFEFDLKTKHLLEFYTSESGQTLKLNINSLLYTRNNVLLIGSESGLYSVVERKQHFGKITMQSEADNPDIISCIEKKGNQVFAGSWGKGLLKQNESTKFLDPVKFKSTNIASPQFIFTLKKIDKTYWFSDKNHLGIFNFNEGKEPYNLNYIQWFTGLNGNQEMNTVTSLLQKNDHSLLLGTWEGNLYYHNSITKQFIILTNKDNQLPQSKGLPIYSLLEDNEGNIWVALSGGGVIKMKIENNAIVSQQLINVEKGLVSNFVTSLYQTRNNKIWIGTEAGLTVINPDNTFETAYNKDIILDIQSMIEDPVGFLWLGTQKGLVRINSNHLEEPFKLFDTSDGLNNTSFYLNSLFAEPDYTFYFGGYNGIDYFTPYNIEYNYDKPTPKITNFSLFNDNIYPCTKTENQILFKNIVSTNHINLKYNQNTFSFEFSNLEFQMQDKCQFSYMLKGVDLDWNFKDAAHRYAIYTKLSPGNYTFYLKSTNNDGVWCDQPISVTLSISPPFWASTLAYIFYFIISMFSIFIISYYRLMKVHDKHKQQLKDVEYQKQKELDELKLRFFTNISHEFRTPLTLILGPLSKILKNEKNNPYKEQHLMIFRNASRLLQLTNRIMDFRKSENEQLKLKVEETNISEFIYNIFLFFNYEAQKRNIDYRFKTTFDQNVLIDQEFIESITFNLLSNAFKYTPDDQSITLSVYHDNNGINVTIEDTGKGIPAEQLAHIFDRFYSTTKRNSAGIGLSFTKRLIEQHKGKIQVKSEVGLGSTFTISLPDKDVYSDTEKSTASNKETIVEWNKIDQSIQQTVSDEISHLKNLYEKDELLALVVDDNFEVRQFITSLIENEFNVIEASNGKEALEKAFNQIPDIVISDIMMPEMDGLELCKILKSDQRTDHIPVILTTVLSSQTDRIEGLSHGADSYIPKPIDPNHLLIRINKLIEKQLKLKEKFKLSNLAIEQSQTNDPVEELHPLVEKARKIVLQNIDNSDYNIDEFCNDLGLSRMQLYRKFKAITGLSANNFIRKVRLHKAAEMLKTGNYTVKEVTYDVGFIDLKYFRKCFNDEFGVNPSVYGQVSDKR